MPNHYNGWFIRKAHAGCLWKRGEIDNMRVCVTSPMGREFVYHQRKLNELKPELSSLLLRNAPKFVFRTEGCKGVPWVVLRTDNQGQPFGELEYVDLLVSLAAACGFLTLTFEQVSYLYDSLPLVVVEDRRIVSWRKSAGRRKVDAE